MHQIQRILFLKQDPTSKVNIQVDERTEVGNLLFNMSPETPSASVIRIRSIDNLIIDKIYIKDIKNSDTCHHLSKSTSGKNIN